ncbi:MAG: hypothetical protein MUO25_10425 [Thermoanaerobaculaceae bacterium]|nr:hypothetical protein [Thermoanaerobaculaceae bacterium]
MIGFSVLAAGLDPGRMSVRRDLHIIACLADGVQMQRAALVSVERALRACSSSGTPV